jgi:hypothetical protein
MSMRMVVRAVGIVFLSTVLSVVSVAQMQGGMASGAGGGVEARANAAFAAKNPGTT